MGKTFQVEIGGKSRALRFHQRDAIELKKRFGETPHKLLFLRCLGLDFSNVEPGESAHMDPSLFDPEVQFAVLHKAVMRGGWNLTEDALINAVDTAMQESEGKVSLGDYVAQAVYCAFYSGAITGQQVDLQEKKADTDTPPADGGEGNAQASGNP